ncbi:MAG: hypothetical protein ABS43_01735 [Bordetella sp. SCN 67-23]|nr:hypothetical protein [Burkholderiales bacterium]ODS76293.1 MAG: hypothetical protein ABS43_01735 [Bordetella sp. SCN 67-23]OJW90096.1 MAG: hypothetical protein BGO71_27670 [Burkholderiales bacterium 67-32]
MALMGIREYARHRGVRHRAVQKAIESGRIRSVDGEDGRPKIDPVQADRDWELNTDETRVAFTANGGRLLDDGAAMPADDDLDDDVDDVPLSGADDHAKAYRHARAIRERASAELRQIEVEKARGKVIDVEEARRIAYTAFRRLRDSAMSVAPRLKDLCAAESDPLVIETMIENEIMAAFGQIDVAALLTDREED